MCLIRETLFINVAVGFFFFNDKYLAKHEWKSVFLTLNYLYNNVYSQ